MNYVYRFMVEPNSVSASSRQVFLRLFDGVNSRKRMAPFQSGNGPLALTTKSSLKSRTLKHFANSRFLAVIVH
jgi:hypothetical protein